jgi:hypothetical protein
MGNPIFRFFEMLIAISPERAAGPIVELALSERYARVNGAYFVGGKVRPSSPTSYDQQLQEQLWADSEALLAAAPTLVGQVDHQSDGNHTEPVPGAQSTGTAPIVVSGR